MQGALLISPPWLQADNRQLGSRRNSLCRPILTAFINLFLTQCQATLIVYFGCEFVCAQDEFGCVSLCIAKQGNYTSTELSAIHNVPTNQSTLCSQGGWGLELLELQRAVGRVKFSEYT